MKSHPKKTACARAGAAIHDAPRGYEIIVSRRSRPERLSDRRIRQVVQSVLEHHSIRACQLEIVILGTASIARLNRQWLGHEGPTDVIAFDVGEGLPRETGQVVGQINACWPVACKEAARRGHPAQSELLLYVVHGLLHLLGYDDHDPRAAQAMHLCEDALLAAMGLGRVYASS